MAKGDIKEVNGFKYSREAFEGHKRRAIITLIAYGEDYRFDFYTDNINKDSAFMDMLSFIKKGTNIKMIHWCTKEQDDATTKLIEETLNDFDSMEKTKLGLEMDNKPTDDFYTHGSY